MLRCKQNVNKGICVVDTAVVKMTETKKVSILSHTTDRKKFLPSNVDH